MPERLDPPRKPVGPSTLSVHGGEPRPKPANALATPIIQTATFTFANTQELKDHFDGKIDRWQYYSETGVAEKEGYSRKGTTQPDTWQYFDAKGNLTRREIDENGDGKVDRTENFLNGRVASVGVDSDGDGRIERWQTWVGGRVISEELDTDGDGIGDRRLRYGAKGLLAGMDILTARSVKAGAPAR